MAATAQATAQATAKKNDPVISPKIEGAPPPNAAKNTLPSTITPTAATPAAKKSKPEAEPKEPSKLVEVSGLKYWLQGDAPFNNENNADKPGARYLSYNIFLVISLLGGFLALDHLYLRSPLTFVAKLAVNLTFFGVWWIWDAAQALFNEPVVRVYGLGIPGMGPQGIGAGVLAEEKPDGKHMRFFTYAVALIFGGLIGSDYLRHVRLFYCLYRVWIGVIKCTSFSLRHRRLLQKMQDILGRMEPQVQWDSFLV